MNARNTHVHVSSVSIYTALYACVYTYIYLGHLVKSFLIINSLENIVRLPSGGGRGQARRRILLVCPLLNKLKKTGLPSNGFLACLYHPGQTSWSSFLYSDVVLRNSAPLSHLPITLGWSGVVSMRDDERFNAYPVQNVQNQCLNTILIC